MIYICRNCRVQGYCVMNMQGKLLESFNSHKNFANTYLPYFAYQVKQTCAQKKTKVELSSVVSLTLTNFQESCLIEYNNIGYSQSWELAPIFAPTRTVCLKGKKLVLGKLSLIFHIHDL